MRTGVWEVILTAATASLVLSTAAWSRPIPRRIEGIDEIRLCMSEREFRSKAPTYIGPYRERIFGGERSYIFDDVSFRWPPGTDLIPSSIQVDFEYGVLRSLQLKYLKEDYPDRLLEVHYTIRNYLLNTYPVNRFTPFNVYMDRSGIKPYYLIVDDKDYNYIHLDVYFYMREPVEVFVQIKHLLPIDRSFPEWSCWKTRY